MLPYLTYGLQVHVYSTLFFCLKHQGGSRDVQLLGVESVLAGCRQCLGMACRWRSSTTQNRTSARSLQSPECTAHEALICLRNGKGDVLLQGSISWSARLLCSPLGNTFPPLCVCVSMYSKSSCISVRVIPQPFFAQASRACSHLPCSSSSTYVFNSSAMQQFIFLEGCAHF